MDAWAELIEPWHPEFLLGSPQQRNLFAALVRARHDPAAPADPG